MRKIKTGKIKVCEIKHSENSRLRDMDDVSDLMHDIELRGQLTPVGIRNKDNTLMFGNRRVKAFEKLGIEEIEADFYEDVSDNDLLIVNIIENIKRKGISPIEIGRICKILEDRGMTRSEISEQLGITKSKLEAAISAYTHTVGTPFEKLVTQGRNSRDTFGIPASLIWRIETTLTRAKTLTKEDWDILLSAIEQRKLTIEHISALRKILMGDRNMSITRALDLLDRCKVIHIFFHLNDKVLSNEMNKEKFGNEIEFIKNIIRNYNKELMF